MEEEFEIFCRDLKSGVQKELLEFYKIKDPEEMNWDVFPVVTIYPPEEE